MCTIILQKYFEANQSIYGFIWLIKYRYTTFFTNNLGYYKSGILLLNEKPKHQLAGYPVLSKHSLATFSGHNRLIHSAMVECSALTDRANKNCFSGVWSWKNVCYMWTGWGLYGMGWLWWHGEPRLDGSLGPGSTASIGSVNCCSNLSVVSDPGRSTGLEDGGIWGGA